MVPAARKKNKIASGKKKNDHYSYFFILQQRLYRTSEAPLKLLHVYYNLTIYVLHTNR